MLSLYDTRLRAVVEIRPARPGELRMYACGPTVYRFAHVGNMRTFLLPDLIRRNAERQGLSVIVCQNITDVGHLADDGEIDPSWRGQDPGPGQGRGQVGAGHRPLLRGRRSGADCAALNILPADFAPRASESIDLMIDMIAKLIETGHAYADRQRVGVLRRAQRRPTTARSPATGSMSCSRAIGSRASVDEQKRFHADWALWKGAPPEPRADLGGAVGHRVPRLAHRVLGHVAASSSAT